MTSEIRLLDRAILDAFDEAISTYAPAVRAGLMHPGLDPATVHERIQSAGLRPSREAVNWWSYYALQPTGGAVPRDVLPDFQFLSVERSITKYRGLRASAEETARFIQPKPDPDDAWGSEWLPIFFIRSGGEVVLDNSLPAPSPSRVRAVYPDTAFQPEHGSVIAPSLGEFLIRAAAWMKAGKCRYEPEHGSWWPRDAWAGTSPAERFLP